MRSGYRIFPFFISCIFCFQSLNPRPMKINSFLIRSTLMLVILFLNLNLYATPIDNVWNAFEQGDRKLARELLNKSISDPQFKVEASMILILLNSIEEKDGSINLMEDIFPTLSDPSPYLFSVWFSDAVTDGYDKKDAEHLKFMKTIFSSIKVNGSIKASLHYMFGMHYLFSNDIKNARKEWASVGSLTNWQFTGPFDNTSGSGFDKAYDPITHPEPGVTFKSKTNADIAWFTPKYFEYDPWTSFIYYVPVQQAVCYAQTFVNSPVDQDVTLAFGGYGSLKVWVNDQLLIQQEEERQTDLDIFKQTVKLNKGDNRILVQVGYTDKTSYPNFIVRLLDSNGESVKGLTTSSEYKSYTKADSKSTTETKRHFAEEYFEQKIKEEPSNILYHLLLAKTYYRRQDHNKAIEILKKAQKIYPNNILVNYELMLNYNKMDDRTEILKQVEFIRSIDPDLLFLAEYDFEIDFKNENYSDAEKDMKKIKKAVGEEKETYINYLIRYQIAKQDYQALYTTIEDAFKKYPDNIYYLNIYSKILKNTTSSSTKTIKLLEKYLVTNYNSTIIDALLEEYQNLNSNSKVENSLIAYHQMLPEETTYRDKLINYYYGAKEYKKALDVVNKGLENAPYHNVYWYDKGYIDFALNDKDAAITDFQTALQYNPNLFEAREKIREMQDKTPILSFFRDTLIYETIDNGLDKLKKTDDNFQYILYNRNFAVFPEGASVEYTSFAIKIQNESGIKHWKDVYIPYNSYQQSLIIEKAEVIKKNGQKAEAEENDNEMVFPSLEVGDVIYCAYRIENYTGGKLCKEFWEDHIFNAFVPMQTSTFRLLTPKGYKFDIDTTNLNQQAEKFEQDDFDLYEWNFSNPQKCKDEDYMPPMSEVGMALNISTVSSWKTIADWYSDIAIPQAKEDYNVLQAYDEIFKDTVYNSDYDKAKAIYDYICENIRYSSVSFLQSNHTPQKPMVTLSTQLGDCKDLATLYYTLAKKAGLKTHLVLVNTRNNGENAIKMPSLNFNHVIIKIDIGDTTIYQELTSEKLGFGTIPSNIRNAQALVVPNTKDDTVGAKLIHLPTKSLINTEIKRYTTIKVDNNNLNISTTLNVEGSAAAFYKHDYSGLTDEEMREQVKSAVSKDFENNLQLDTFSVKNVDNRDSSFTQSCDFKLKGEVKTIGGLSAVKPPFFEKIFTVDAFTKEERNYPISYWAYEPNNYYETNIILELPKTAKLEELPKNITITNKFIDYKLTIQKIQDNKVSITRIVKINNETLPVSSYNEFKETMQQVLKAEDIYIGYK